MKKKKWEKPKVLVLTRGKPEEAVLLGCKIENGPAGACTTTASCGNSCAPCEDWAQPS